MKRMTTAATALLLILAILTALCGFTRSDACFWKSSKKGSGTSTDLTGAGSTLTIQKTDKREALSNSVATLNNALFDKAVSGKNVFYSPYSILGCLLLADAGAAGNTKAQMEQVLGITDLPEVLTEYNSYRTQNPPESAKLTTANALWINTAVLGDGEVRPAYLSTVKSYLGATVRSEAFSSKPPEEISKWVKQNTGGLISDYKPIVQEDAAMDLLNAVYFDGKWDIPFPHEGTARQTFTNLDGSTVKTSLMTQSGKQFRLYEKDGLRGLELPYKDSSVVMDLILTADEKDRDTAKAWKTITASDRTAFLQGIDRADRRNINVLTLPKFENDLSLDGLKDMLVELGMSDLFSARADLSGISDHSLCASDIAHRAKIQVDEEGSRAAAVTEMMLSETALLISEWTEFRCDRPFVYLIRDKDSGVVLFTGVYNTAK